jgi:catechol 2,3-dioxygenase
MQTQDAATVLERGARPRYFRPRRLGHVNLVVGSTDESMHFYNTVVGLQEAYRVVAIEGGFLSNGNTHHDVGVVQSSGPAGHGRKPGLNHLAFELETEVDLVDSYTRAKQDGVVFQRTLDHDIAHSAYCADPDGNSCELYADVIRDWRNARTGSVTKPKPQWWPGLTPPSGERNYDPAPEVGRVEDAAFHPLRTKHATLVVADLEASVRFYTTIVGLDLLVRPENNVFALLGGTCGERNVALVQAQPGQAAGFHHFGLEVATEADLDESLASLRAKRLAADSVVDHALRKSVYLRDPDGLLLQIFVDRRKEHSGWAGIDPQLALWVV